MKEHKIQRTEGLEYRGAFYTSAANAILERLKEERKESGSTGTQLVLAKDVKINQYCKTHYPFLKKVDVKTRDHYLGSQDGYQAGKNLKLTRGLDRSSDGNGQLDGSRKALSSK